MPICSNLPIPNFEVEKCKDQFGAIERIVVANLNSSLLSTDGLGASAFSLEQIKSPVRWAEVLNYPTALGSAHRLSPFLSGFSLTESEPIRFGGNGNDTTKGYTYSKSKTKVQGTFSINYPSQKEIEFWSRMEDKDIARFMFLTEGNKIVCESIARTKPPRVAQYQITRTDTDATYSYMPAEGDDLELGFIALGQYEFVAAGFNFTRQTDDLVIDTNIVAPISLEYYFDVNGTIFSGIVPFSGSTTLLGIFAGQPDPVNVNGYYIVRSYNGYETIRPSNQQQTTITNAPFETGITIATASHIFEVRFDKFISLTPSNPSVLVEDVFILNADADLVSKAIFTHIVNRICDDGVVVEASELTEYKIDNLNNEFPINTTETLQYSYDVIDDDSYSYRGFEVRNIRVRSLFVGGRTEPNRITVEFEMDGDWSKTHRVIEPDFDLYNRL